MQSISLKYRPTNYDELVGQSAVSKSLKYALDNNRIANAYLFSGLRGSGKTSSARILAKALNCMQGISSKPCGVCSNCTSNNTDIYELDAASNRGIDSIQNLIENTKYMPLNSRFKIFIIDEVHMLTREAFNALLKTLEEPPSYVKFILATTDAHKLPPTILSRVLHFRFKKISIADIVNRMEFILNNEQIPYEKAALSILARSSSGSMRDALTLLEQAIIYSNNNINQESITNMLGIIDPKLIKDFFLAIIKNDDNKVFDILNNFLSYEVSTVLDELKYYLKDSFINRRNEFSTLLYERFFYILSKATNMAKQSDDDEFVLCLVAMMLKEALKMLEIDNEIFEDNKDDNFEDEYELFVRKVKERDYVMGKIFDESVTFISFNGVEFAIKVNPKNDEEKSHFKNYFSVLKEILYELYPDAKFVITTDIKPEEVQKNQNIPTIKEPINNYANEEEYEEKYPELQSDDFLDNPLEDDVLEEELDIPDVVLENFEDYHAHLILESFVKFELNDDILYFHMITPEKEEDKNILRFIIKEFLNQCVAFYNAKKWEIVISKKKLY